MDVDPGGIDEFHSANTTADITTFEESMWIDWDVPILSGHLPFDPFA